MMRFISKRSRAAAWDAWCRLVGERKLASARASRTVAACRRCRAVNAVRAWQAYTARQVRLQVLFLRAVFRFQTRRIALALDAWMLSLEASREELAIALTQQRAQQRKHALMQRAVVRLQQHCVSSAWDAWRRGARGSRAARARESAKQQADKHEQQCEKLQRALTLTRNRLEDEVSAAQRSNQMLVALPLPAPAPAPLPVAVAVSKTDSMQMATEATDQVRACRASTQDATWCLALSDTIMQDDVDEQVASIGVSMEEDEASAEQGEEPARSTSRSGRQVQEQQDIRDIEGEGGGGGGGGVGGGGEKLVFRPGGGLLTYRVGEGIEELGEFWSLSNMDWSKTAGAMADSVADAAQSAVDLARAAAGAAAEDVAKNAKAAAVEVSESSCLSPLCSSSESSLFLF
jgi:hypothetical protein